MKRRALEDLLSDIQHLQSVMVAVSTGGPPINDKEEEYKDLYWKIDERIDECQQEGLVISNPNPFKSLWDWYGYWSSNLPSYQSRRSYINSLYDHLVDPIQRALKRFSSQGDVDDALSQDVTRRLRKAAESTVTTPYALVEIQESLAIFQRDHPDHSAAFIMMKFTNHVVHQEVVSSIKAALQRFGIVGVRADDKEYHDDLYYNILTYIYGCRFGIAVFDRVETEQFNPNVALEVGYMLALRKPVCLLKDKTLPTLHSDLMGKLYRPFDPHDVSTTLSRELSKWISDRGL